MSKAGILCPTCKGTVGISIRGEPLERALERHQHLAHGVNGHKPAMMKKPTKVAKKLTKVPSKVPSKTPRR